MIHVPAVRRLGPLFFLLTLAGGAARAQDAGERIRLNQIGFYPEAAKAAVVVGAPAAEFHVTTPDGSDTVFTAMLGPSKTWSPSSEAVRLADFSALRAEGDFVVTVPGVGASHPFRIAPYVHQEIAKAAVKGFYFQRASTSLHPRYADRWARSAGHPDTSVAVHPSAATDARPAGTRIRASKGWYDAGDYNKYIVNSGISTGTLLMLYEHFPAYFDALELGIPESGDGVPDLLDEILWNLRWMLAMQDPADGGVYHKLTTPNFEGIVMPSQARQQRYVVQKGTAAALDFAAVTALAARVYDDFEAELPGLADSLRSASTAAWGWALQNQEVRYSQSALNQQFDPDVNTGEYGDGSFFDEFRWAAAELFITTGDDLYLQLFDPLAENVGVPGWPNVGTLAYYSLAHHRAAVAARVDTATVKSRLTTFANQLVSARRESAYGIVMGRSNGDFHWGSNSGAANQAMLLLQVYRFSQDARYLEAALSNLDYLLGRNAVGLSFVTGHGDRTPMNPHHRQSWSDAVREPVPGLLVGGPNPNREDGCPGYPSTLPARAYLDDGCSYASNEIAINWNAPLAYLAGAVEALLSPDGRPTATAVEHAPERPEAGGQGLGLVSFPNPARGAAVAAFELAAAASVSLAVYDVQGRVVARLLAAERLPAGRHAVPFDARLLAGGAYLLRLHAGPLAATRLLFVTP